MLSPLSRVLLKIFARGFYRVHAGLLLTLFVTVFIYFFFINVLNQTHLTPAERLLYNLSLVLAFISHPVVMGTVFLLWLLYTVKSWQYVAAQLTLAEQQFLFYSSTAQNRLNQFKSWFLVQLVILLPVIGYGLFSLVIGVLFKYYLSPVIILLYILLLAGVSALVYIRLLNRLPEEEPRYLLQHITRNWPKPYFSLFLYHILDKQKLAFVLTKIIAGIIGTGILYFFSDVRHDARVAAITVLAIVTAHSVLIYQEHWFRETYMGFARNLPYRRSKLLLHFALLVVLLLLPESITLFATVKPGPASWLFLFGLSTALLFWSLLYWFGLNMRKYLRWVGALFLLFQLVIMFGYVTLLVPVNLGIAFLLFYRHYYAYKPESEME